MFSTEDLKNLKKEDFRILEGDPDKDIDSSCVNQNDMTVSADGLASSNCPESKRELDILQVRRALQRLYDVSNDIFEASMVNGLRTLSQAIEIDLRVYKVKGTLDDMVSSLKFVYKILLKNLRIYNN